MTVENAEREVVVVLHHQTDQEPVVTNVVGFDDNLIILTIEYNNAKIKTYVGQLIWLDVSQIHSVPVLT